MKKNQLYSKGKIYTKEDGKGKGKKGKGKKQKVYYNSLDEIFGSSSGGPNTDEYYENIDDPYNEIENDHNDIVAPTNHGPWNNGKGKGLCRDGSRPYYGICKDGILSKITTLFSNHVFI